MFYCPPGESTQPNIEHVTDELKTLFQNAQTKLSNQNANLTRILITNIGSDSRSRKNYLIALNDYKNNRSAANKTKLQKRVKNIQILSITIEINMNTTMQRN
jgi:hypothetical protein